ncbi:ATPase domain-containing protein [Desulfallas thermosapovorans]|uniref:KaiC protein n=1 Tax=Desulfallas thermosapovorans DSM 6562 TaxID=1121431 RepID=A0A5S4ZZ61_9FIRM|nr:ATPase domain-containing protein [Desulfallas thermosapovorans]TYO97421.1 KaiC protein [Desulfallas thermosapovorans DSM 6562]
MTKIPTGIKGFDKLLYGGIVPGNSVLIEGVPGAMREHLLSFDVGTPAYEETGRLIFIDAYEEEGSTEKFALADH